MTEPMYRQIADDLQRRIESGDLSPGEQIKTEAELREEFGQDGRVSRNTVREAIRFLVSRGLVETRPGQGTFVVSKIDPFVTTFTGPMVEDPGPDAQMDVTQPRVEIQLASKAVAEELGLDQGETVVSRHQERRLNGRQWSLRTTFYPMGYVTRGAGRLIEAIDIPESVMTYLQRELGITEVGTRDMITARAPDRNEAAFFGLPDDGRVAIMEVSRTGFDEHGHPTRLTITVYPADRNVLAFEAGQLPGGDHNSPAGRRPDTRASEAPDRTAGSGTR